MTKNALLLFNLLFSALLFSQAGNLDTSFNPETNNYRNIRCIALQSNNKILIGTDAYKGQPTPLLAIARLNMNGSVDNTFNPKTGYNNFHVFSIAEQSDGKIIVGGWDNNSGAKNYISRLNSD